MKKTNLSNKSDKQLLEGMGLDTTPQKKAKHSSPQERLIDGFEQIATFVDKTGHLPQFGEDKDIFERIYAVRLAALHKQKASVDFLLEMDRQNLFKRQENQTETALSSVTALPSVDDAVLLEALGLLATNDDDITHLKHVPPPSSHQQASRAVNDDIAVRKPCTTFDKFRPLFEKVQRDLSQGVRKTRRFGTHIEIKKGEYFILKGQIVYIDSMGKKFVDNHGQKDSRLGIIYDNGTQSNLLERSLVRALYKDKTGRRITQSDIGGLFSNIEEAGDIQSGTVYVLKSLSEHPFVSKNRDVIHKIGVTSGNLKQRLSRVQKDPTFLMAGVEVVATYKLSNISKYRFESLLHHLFHKARLDITIKDRFGHPVSPKEWFLVPLFIIDDVIQKITSGTIENYIYDAKNVRLRKV